MLACYLQLLQPPQNKKAGQNTKALERSSTFERVLVAKSNLAAFGLQPSYPHKGKCFYLCFCCDPVYCVYALVLGKSVFECLAL